MNEYMGHPNGFDDIEIVRNPLINIRSNVNTSSWHLFERYNLFRTSILEIIIQTHFRGNREVRHGSKRKRRQMGILEVWFISFRAFIKRKSIDNVGIQKQETSGS
jgi:hypothetical protein